MILSNSKRILILDEDAQTRTMMRLLLSEEGHVVSLATGSLEAISMHRQNPFDLVIMELLLAGQDGFETFAELRRTTKPPRLIATSRPSWIPAEVNLKIARQLGADETLAKPFDPGELLDAVRNVLALN
jgi:DNA-binding response OmpR family regulator